MKRFMIYFVFTLLLALIASCEVEEELIPQTNDFEAESRSSTTWLHPDSTYLYNATTSYLGSVLDTMLTDSVDFITYNGTHYVFEGFHELRNWADGFSTTQMIEFVQNIDSVIHFRSLTIDPDIDPDENSALLPKGFIHEHINSGGKTWSARGWRY